jgi:hypothetical protein
MANPGHYLRQGSGGRDDTGGSPSRRLRDNRRRRSAPSQREFDRVLSEEGVADAVRRLEQRWHMHDPPSGYAGVLRTCLVRACVPEFSLSCDSCWEAHTPPS